MSTAPDCGRFPQFGRLRSPVSLTFQQTVSMVADRSHIGDTGGMIEVSVETLATVFTGLGVVVAMFSAMAVFSSSLRREIREVESSLRKEIQVGDESLRTEIGELRTDMQAGDESLRSAMQAGDESLRIEIGELRTQTQNADDALRQEISELRGDMKAELRSLNDRLDGTNMRIDRLVDSLRMPASA